MTAFNVIGHRMDQSPGPILFVVPKVEDVPTFFVKRVDPFLTSSPQIARLVSSSELQQRGTGRATNRIGMVKYAGAYLKVAGSSPATTYQEASYALIVLDDFSRFERNADGDHIELARARTNTYSRLGAKVLVISTPRIAPDPVWSALADSSWNQCYVPCPHCGVEQILTQPNLRWTKGAPTTAHFVCVHCTLAIYEHSKKWMLARHKWRPSQPQFSGRVEGYHFPAYYARSIYRSWVGIAESRENALTKLQAANDHKPLQVCTNLDDAQPWHPPELVKLAGIERDVYNRREPDIDIARQSAARGLITTVGTDRQHDRLEAGSIRFGPGCESWHLEHKVIKGNTMQNVVWDEWAEWLLTTGAQAACVDGSDQKRATCDQITRLLRDQLADADILVWVIKGHDGEGEIWPKAIESGKIDKVTQQVSTVLVKVDEATGWVLTCLYDTTIPGPGYMHIPSSRGQRWVRQLFGRRKRISTDKPGGGTYVKVPGRRREVLDCTKYAYAALHGAARVGVPEALLAVGAIKERAPIAPPAPKPITRSRSKRRNRIGSHKL